MAQTYAPDAAPTLVPTTKRKQYDHNEFGFSSLYADKQQVLTSDKQLCLTENLRTHSN